MNEWFNLKKNIPPIGSVVLFYLSNKSKNNSYWIGCKHKNNWTYINLSNFFQNNIITHKEWDPVENLKKLKNCNYDFYWRFIDQDFNLLEFASSIIEIENRFEILDIREKNE